eukprot:982424_1
MSLHLVQPLQRRNLPSPIPHQTSHKGLQIRLYHQPHSVIKAYFNSDWWLVTVLVVFWKLYKAMVESDDVVNNGPTLQGEMVRIGAGDDDEMQVTQEGNPKDGYHGNTWNVPDGDFVVRKIRQQNMKHAQGCYKDDEKIVYGDDGYDVDMMCMIECTE